MGRAMDHDDDVQDGPDGSGMNCGPVKELRSHGAGRWDRRGHIGFRVWSLASGNYGWGKISSKTKAAQPDADEYDADLLWQLKAPNLWLRMRFGVMHQYENPQQFTYDGRISLNYDFQLL